MYHNPGVLLKINARQLHHFLTLSSIASSENTRGPVRSPPCATPTRSLSSFKVDVGGTESR
eukprot:3126641-Lingulodinium_polyedra.AAC.1